MAVQHRMAHAVGTTVAGPKATYLVGDDRFLRRLVGRGMVSQGVDVLPEDEAEFAQFPKTFKVVKVVPAPGTPAPATSASPPAAQQLPGSPTGDGTGESPEAGGEPPPVVLPFGGLLNGSVHKIRGDLLTGRFNAQLDEIIAVELAGKARKGVVEAVNEQKALLNPPPQVDPPGDDPSGATDGGDAQIPAPPGSTPPAAT